MSGNVTAALNPNLNPLAIYTGQQVVTATATALPDKVLANGVILTAASGNAAAVLVGYADTVTTAVNGSGIGYPLAAGASISFGTTNTKSIYIIGTANDVVYWAGN